MQPWWVNMVFTSSQVTREKFRYTRGFHTSTLSTSLFWWKLVIKITFVLKFSWYARITRKQDRNISSWSAKNIIFPFSQLCDNLFSYIHLDRILGAAGSPLSRYRIIGEFAKQSKYCTKKQKLVSVQKIHNNGHTKQIYLRGYTPFSPKSKWSTQK